MAAKKQILSSSDLKAVERLEDLPNIGKSLAADFRRIGILKPADLLTQEPLVIYQELGRVMGPRHDPCVFYTLLAVRHFLKHSEALSWWKFTTEGKEILSR